MAAKPGHSLPQMFKRRYDLKAAYNLFQRPEATPDHLQATHRELVNQQLHQSGTYLLLEDTTDVSWVKPLQPGGKPRARGRAGLGRLGPQRSGQHGFRLHSVLAVRWPQAQTANPSASRPAVEVLGLADQQYFIREPRKAGGPLRSRRGDKKTNYESYLWESATARLGTAPDSASVRWVRVSDRESDIYDYLKGCKAEGHGFVVRAARDRALVGGQGQPAGRLFAVARAKVALGGMSLQLRARAGQPARQARLKVSATRVRIRATQEPGHRAGGLPPVEVSLVRVWEGDPPVGVKGLEWILLCEGEVSTLEQAQETVRQYASRWLVEEFHKALKSGMGVERLQLERGERLMAATAVMSVVALRLLALREQVEREPQAAAGSTGLSEMELEVLEAASERRLETASDVALALGQLGGHLNRKADGLPGWQSMWRGWLQLQTMVEGVRLAHKLKRFG